MPADEQDELAAALFAQMPGQHGDGRLTQAQIEEVSATGTRLASGDEDIVPDGEMAAFWRSCGL